MSDENAVKAFGMIGFGLLIVLASFTIFNDYPTPTSSMALVAQWIARAHWTLFGLFCFLVGIDYGTRTTPAREDTTDVTRTGKVRLIQIVGLIWGCLAFLWFTLLGYDCIGTPHWFDKRWCDVG